MSNIHRALDPPVDAGEVRRLIPEFSLARDLEQSPYHHLDTFDHVLEVIRGVERELSEKQLGARVERNSLPGLRFAALLHDVAKPVTRGEVEGKVLFVAHDSLGARLVHRICLRLNTCALLTDLAVTLTALHLKIGFMESEFSDYPPERVARAAGPFGEELAVLSWADRLAAQGPRLKPEHVKRHRRLCGDFLRVSRKLGPYPEPDYERLAKLTPLSEAADAGYAASRLRLLTAQGVDEGEARGYVAKIIKELHKGDA